MGFIIFYNLLFTSLPVIVLGAFDQDINAKAALAYPQLYVRGIRGLEYTKFWFYMLDGLFQSAVVFFIPYPVWQLAVSYNGKGIDSLADFGTIVAVAAIFTANTYIRMNTHYWTFITWVVVIGSSLVMILQWVVIYSFIAVNSNFFSQTHGFVDEVVVLFSNITFWATVVISIIVALAPRFLTKFFKSTYMPLDKEIVREMWVAGDLKDRLGIRRRKESRNKHIVDLELETAPMFCEPHARSASELTMQQGYEPTTTRSPADSDVGGGSPNIESTDTAELATSHLLSAPYETRAPAVPRPAGAMRSFGSYSLYPRDIVELLYSPLCFHFDIGQHPT